VLIAMVVPIALIETWLIWKRIGASADADAVVSRDIANSVLMRLTFATQLIVELLIHNKTVGGIAACVAGVSAGLLTMRSAHLEAFSELAMNVFMGVSMGIFLVGSLPRHITILLITPVLGSSVFTWLHVVMRKRLAS